MGAKVYKAIKGNGDISISYKKKGRTHMPFKCDFRDLLVIDHSKNEVRIYNKFSGSRIINYYSEPFSLIYKPERSRRTKNINSEYESLMAQVEAVDLVSLNFLKKQDCDLKEDFPEIIEEASKTYKERFS